jgi:hypothetical protein
VSVTFRKDGSGNGNEPATGADAAGDDPQLARARDGQSTPSPLTLPDTERVRERVEEVLESFRVTRDRVWSGEIWDTQPPSPRELIDRGKDGPWANSEVGALRFLAWAGRWFAVVWSVLWYSGAITGQRYGRAVTVISTIALFLYLA